MSAMDGLFAVIDLVRMEYAAAYALQCRHVDEVLAARGGGDVAPWQEGVSAGRVLLVEHDPPVITVTRRPGAPSHLLATPEQLRRAGVKVAQTDRGGDITYHGPGQLVVYPILDLNLLRLRLHDYMRLLERAVIDACAQFGLVAGRDPGATGVWLGEGAELRKICAMGVRVRRWVSMHGLALNVATNLEHFDLIVPCGLAGRRVTSLKRELGAACPGMDEVKAVLVSCLDERLRAHLAREPAPA